jgi:hypothetical protein
MTNDEEPGAIASGNGLVRLLSLVWILGYLPMVATRTEYRTLDLLKLSAQLGQVDTSLLARPVSREREPNTNKLPLALFITLLL